MQGLERMVAVLNRTLLWCAAAVILAAMAMAVLNMAGRPFKMPIRGSFELMGLAGALIAAFALGIAQENKNHIAVDILFQRFPAGLRRVLDVLSHLTCALFFGFAAYRLARFGFHLYTTGEVSETLGIVTYPFVFCVVLGLLSLSLTLLVEAFGGFSQTPGKRSAVKAGDEGVEDGDG